MQQNANNGGNLFWIHFGAVLTVTAWGLSVIFTQDLIRNEGLNATEIYIYRFILAYLMVLAVCHEKLWANSWQDELAFLACGLFGGSIYFITENTALKYAFASNVSLIVTTTPLITILLVGMMNKKSRPKRGVVIGSIIAFLGVACVIFNSSFVIKINPLGDFLALLAAISFAIYSIVLKRLDNYSVMFISRKTFFYGILTAIPFLLFEQTPRLCSPTVFLRAAVWSRLLFLGIFASMLAFVIWSNAVKRLGAVKASNYLYFVPIVTLIASALLIEERITYVGCVGCVLILGGVWLGDIIERKKHKKG